jgi:uncharacterized membrane protein YdjX (TVP38/TMEM64 family)
VNAEPGRKAGRPGVPGKPIALTIGLAAAMVVGVLAIDPLRDAVGDAVSGETGSLRRDLRGLGAGGVALIAALAALHTFIWYPAEILDAAAGYVYGFGPAMAILVVCWTAQAMLAYEIGRRAARPLLERIVGEQRLVRLERAVENGGVTLLLAARLVPIVPFSLFSFVAGAATAPRFRFLWTTAVGYLPITAVAVYLGTTLEDLSPTDPRVWAAVVAVLSLLLLARLLRPLIEGEAPEGEEP